MTSNLITANRDVLEAIRHRIRRLKAEACILHNFMQGINQTVLDKQDYDYFKELGYPVELDELFGCRVVYESTESKG